MKTYSATTKQFKTMCGNIFITINKDDKGNIRKIWPELGKTGTCVRCHLYNTGFLAVEAIKGGRDIKRIVEHLLNSTEDCRGGNKDLPNCIVALGLALKDEIKE